MAPEIVRAKDKQCNLEHSQCQKHEFNLRTLLAMSADALALLISKHICNCGLSGFISCSALIARWCTRDGDDGRRRLCVLRIDGQM